MDGQSVCVMRATEDAEESVHTLGAPPLKSVWQTHSYVSSPCTANSTKRVGCVSSFRMMIVLSAGTPFVTSFALRCSKRNVSVVPALCKPVQRLARE
jgi:hypothetical protein